MFPFTKGKLAAWNNHVEDYCISTMIITPIVKRIFPDPSITAADGTYHISQPHDRTPNMYGFIGMLCIMATHWVSGWAAAWLILAYIVFDVIDYKYASPLSEMIHHWFNCIVVYFVWELLCKSIHLTKETSYQVLILFELLWLLVNLRALNERILVYMPFSGPNEYLVLLMGVVIYQPNLQYGVSSVIEILIFCAIINVIWVNQQVMFSMMVVSAATVTYSPINLVAIFTVLTTNVALSKMSYVDQCSHFTTAGVICAGIIDVIFPTYKCEFAGCMASLYVGAVLAMIGNTLKYDIKIKWTWGVPMVHWIS